MNGPLIKRRKQIRYRYCFCCSSLDTCVCMSVLCVRVCAFVPVIFLSDSCMFYVRMIYGPSWSDLNKYSTILCYSCSGVRRVHTLYLKRAYSLPLSWYEFCFTLYELNLEFTLSDGEIIVDNLLAFGCLSLVEMPSVPHKLNTVQICWNWYILFKPGYHAP